MIYINELSLRCINVEKIFGETATIYLYKRLKRVTDTDREIDREIEQDTLHKN